MGRAPIIRSQTDFWREPYSIITNLFIDIGNLPLRFEQLRYMLLEKHGLKKDPKKMKKFTEKEFVFHDSKMSLEETRKYHVGKLMTTSGINEGKPMSVNGLNLALKQMRKYNAIEYSKNSYCLNKEYYELCITRRLSETLDYNIIDRFKFIQNRAYFFYRPPNNINLEKILTKNNPAVKSFLDEIYHIWAENKIQQYLEKIKNDKQICSSSCLLGFCSIMNNWFMKSQDFDQKRIRRANNDLLNLAKNDDIKRDARTFVKKYHRISEKFDKRCLLTIKQKSMLLNEFPNLKTEKIPINHIIARLLWEKKKINLEKAINILIKCKIISRKEGDILIQYEKSENTFRNKGLYQIISSQICRKPPHIIIDIDPPEFPWVENRELKPLQDQEYPKMVDEGDNT